MESIWSGPPAAHRRSRLGPGCSFSVPAPLTPAHFLFASFWLSLESSVNSRAVLQSDYVTIRQKCICYFVADKFIGLFSRRRGAFVGFALLFCWSPRRTDSECIYSAYLVESVRPRAERRSESEREKRPRCVPRRWSANGKKRSETNRQSMRCVCECAGPSFAAKCAHSNRYRSNRPAFRIESSPLIDSHIVFSLFRFSARRLPFIRWPPRMAIGGAPHVFSVGAFVMCSSALAEPPPPTSTPPTSESIEAQQSVK